LQNDATNIETFGGVFNFSSFFSSYLRLPFCSGTMARAADSNQQSLDTNPLLGQIVSLYVASWKSTWLCL